MKKEVMQIIDNYYKKEFAKTTDIEKIIKKILREDIRGITFSYFIKNTLVQFYGEEKEKLNYKIVKTIQKGLAKIIKEKYNIKFS